MPQVLSKGPASTGAKLTRIDYKHKAFCIELWRLHLNDLTYKTQKVPAIFVIVWTFC